MIVGGKIGPTSSCNGGNYSICTAGPLLSFVDPRTFALSNGLRNGGGETMMLGSGSTNTSHQIGRSSDGYAITSAALLTRHACFPNNS